MEEATKAAPGGGSGGSEWPTNAISYELMGKIGHGAFATVWKARVVEHQPEQQEEQDEEFHLHRRECAVKVLNLDHVDTNLGEIRREVQAMRLSSHPNVLTCFTAFVHDINLWLVTPLMRKGSSLHCLQTARRILRKQQPPPAPPVAMEEHILYILHETLLGLQYIHENGQIHRDIKAGNILLDGNGDVKIADFGVSGWLVLDGSQQEKAKTFVGTPCWMSPEVLEQLDGCVSALEKDARRAWK
jgi:serine/threonine-protein kinase OSR1/STK39